MLCSFYANRFPGATNGGGYGNNQRSFAQPAGGRQFYGDRQQRMNFNGPPRTGGGYNNFSQSAASSKIDIDSSKVGMVIGRGGGKIREIQVNFNVHVKIGTFLIEATGLHFGGFIKKKTLHFFFASFRS